MLDTNVDRFIQKLSKLERQEDKIITGLQGFFRFFPFSRLSLFSYSPINFIGEGLILIHSDGNIFSMEHIRQDIRDIPIVYEAIRNKRAEYIVMKDTKENFPIQYIQEYKLTSLVVVPLWFGPLVLGCVLIDGYNGVEPISESTIYAIEEYFRLGVNVIAAEYFTEEGARLSKREVEVLERLSDGWSTKEMADIMGISEFTARDYISSAMKKLGARHRAQAIAEAMRMGLIS
ncbi:response regulator transcription factor [Pueribacillus sp. YX66]|uniref:response regulator transcription factor n=1 Tax=Pueribacillus sp. YX66 TaxID=3229242 RepID=UPI00358D4BD6